MDELFGGVCRLTLATGSATWDLDYNGPGVYRQTNSRVEVHTEEGVDAVFDRRAVVGHQILPYKEAINHEAE